jgi:hypothetical protein
MKDFNDDYFYDIYEYEEENCNCAGCDCVIGDEVEYGGAWDGKPVCLNCIQEEREDDEL